MQGSAPSGWMKGASAPLRGALLGLVLEEPGGGGELTGRLQERFGASWQVDRRDVYRLLEGLVREGLLQCREQEQGGAGPATQLIYHATEQTSAALTEWMAAAQSREPPRLAIEAKLAVASERDAPALLRALRRHEMECLAIVRSLPSPGGNPSSAQALMRESARDAMLARLQAEIEWAQRARRRIEEHAAAAR